MRIVQIVGPSYSGSTLLGNVLNSHPGFFFGSEVYRLLSTGPSGGLRVGCESCGSACEYWHDRLKDTLRLRPDATLSSVYDEFARAHTAVRTFVDGSKGLRWYGNEWREIQLISAKHPMRLVSSALYNRSDLVGLRHDTPFADFYAQTRENPSRFFDRIDSILNVNLAGYRKMLASTPRGTIVRTDRLAIDDFAEYRSLCSLLGVFPDTSSVTDFTAHKVHPIGGNKAPMWQRKSRERNYRASFTVDRAKFYATADRSDYRVDNKYKQLLSQELLEYVRGHYSYGDLCDLLGYSNEAD